MIRTLLVVAAVVLVTACGPHWEGAYSGTVAYAVSCSYGVVGNDAWPEDAARITQNGGVLTFSAPTLNCGTLSADVDGTRATLRAKACPSYTVDTFTFSPQVTGDTLSLDNQHLTGNITFTTNVTGPSSGVCTETHGIDFLRAGD
jgi:hypothetical protein